MDLSALTLSAGVVALAEMGDKTQLATIALAAKYNSLFLVWMGTTTGMIIADAIGIVIGSVLGKKMPEKIVKWCAALIFILFGLYGLYEYLPANSWRIPIFASTLLVSTIITLKLARSQNWREKS